MFERWRNKSGASICRYDVTNEDEDENEIFIVVVVVVVVVVDDADRILFVKNMTKMVLRNNKRFDKLNIMKVMKKKY